MGRRAQRRERLRYCADGKFATARKLGPNHSYHLFLSHCWGSGSDQMRITKERLRTILPDLKVFLDVDDLDAGTGVEYVDKSTHVLCFLSAGYTNSVNCMRELLRAVLTGKPVTIMLESRANKGGQTLDADGSVYKVQNKTKKELEAIKIGENGTSDHKIPAES